MSTVKKLHYLLVILALSCNSQENPPMVKNIGELKQIMHQGMFQARVSLDTLPRPNRYGLGAIDSLSGELLILNGEVFQSFVQQDSLIVSDGRIANATLLVYADVSKWDTLNLTSATDLDFELSKVRDLTIPFPFILIGKALIDYHVINFDSENGDFSEHKQGALNGSLKNEQVTLMGFYSTKAKGIYTHHDSNMHIHVINQNKSVMGHVDQIDLAGKSYQLLIPKE